MEIIIYISVYGVLVYLLIAFGWIQIVRKSKRNREKAEISSEEITVLIPFRNEELRLEPLLKSIQNLEKQPARWIFLNDHSNDNGSDLIKNLANSLDNISVIDLPENTQGKKRAILHGVDLVETEFILTMDADVWFESNYFSELEKLVKADMYVLPAILKGENSLERFYELDVAMANAMNSGLAGWTRPIFASGANLLYRKSAYLEVNDLASHEHMASGDDTYLLRDFRNANKKVELDARLSTSVSTETPHSLSEFLDQRIRWAGKTKDVGDHFATFISILQFVLTMTFAFFVVKYIVEQDYFSALLIYALKTGIDIVVFFPYFAQMKRMETWVLIPIYELLFPIYSVIIGVAVLFRKPKWKGRAIYNRS